MDNRLKPSSARESGLNRSMFLAAGAVMTVAGTQAEAAVVYKPLDLTISSAGTNAATIALPAIGITADDNKNGLTFTATTANGVQVTKPSSNGVTINVITAADYPSGAAAYNTPITAFNASDLIAVVDTKHGFSATVNSTLSMISGDGSVGQFPVSAGVKYIGINYVSSQPGSATNFNGWVEYQTLSTGSEVSAHISGIALESTGNLPIAAGSTVSVPEPTSLSLLALGSAGLLTYRKRSACA